MLAIVDYKIIIPRVLSTSYSLINGRVVYFSVVFSKTVWTIALQT